MFSAITQSQSGFNANFLICTHVAITCKFFIMLIDNRKTNQTCRNCCHVWNFEYRKGRLAQGKGCLNCGKHNNFAKMCDQNQKFKMKIGDQTKE